jgi:hypothetical protein
LAVAVAVGMDSDTAVAAKSKQTKQFILLLIEDAVFNPQVSSSA